MYLSHFGLRNYPFEKTLKSDELLDTETQAEARARIGHLIELRGIGLLTGESGVGKTALCRQVLDTLHEGLHQVRYVAFATGNVRDTYNAIANRLRPGGEPVPSRGLPGDPRGDEPPRRRGREAAGAGLR